MANHKDLHFLMTHVTTDVVTGKKIAVCHNAIPNIAREYLKSLNKRCIAEVALGTFIDYFDKKLEEQMFYWDETTKQFKINNYRIKVNDDWVPAPTHKLKTPKVVKHSNL